MNRRNIIIGSITLAILTLILLAIMFIQPTHTISIKTEYSQKFMSSKINEYRSDISEVLFAKYPELKSSFLLQKEIILGNNADWYAASYQRGVIDRNSGDIYTVILKKENNKWVIKTKPQIINTIYNTKDIPEDILSETASRLSPFSTSS